MTTKHIAETQLYGYDIEQLIIVLTSILGIILFGGLVILADHLGHAQPTLKNALIIYITWLTITTPLVPIIHITAEHFTQKYTT